MKKLFSLFLIAVAVCFSMTFTSCESTPAGSEGVGVNWGGKTDMTQVYGEGMHIGFHWVWDDMVNYDIRTKTHTESFKFNDRNNMKTTVRLSIDHHIQKGKSNVVHSTIGKDQLEVKMVNTLSAAAMQIIPQYSASELNLTKRAEAEGKLYDLLSKEFPKFYCECTTVRITDVEIPEGIAATAEANAKQAELNKLAESKVLEAKNNNEAAVWDAKTKEILSQPAMLRMKELEVQMEFAKKGVSPYGNNNVFGAETAIVRGLK